MKTFESLPVKHANRFEMDAFYKLSAMRNTLGMAKEDLKGRASMIPGGWRDLCACSAITGKLVNHMLLTFEEQKRPYIVRQMENSRIRVLFAREASHDPETVIMDVEDLAVLTYYGYEHCKVCMGNPDECSRCQLGNVLDKCSFVSRGNRAWWEVINGAVKDGENEQL